MVSQTSTILKHVLSSWKGTVSFQGKQRIVFIVKDKIWFSTEKHNFEKKMSELHGMNIFPILMIFVIGGDIK